MKAVSTTTPWSDGGVARLPTDRSMRRGVGSTGARRSTSLRTPSEPGESALHTTRRDCRSRYRPTPSRDRRPAGYHRGFFGGPPRPAYSARMSPTRRPSPHAAVWRRDETKVAEPSTAKTVHSAPCLLCNERTVPNSLAELIRNKIEAGTLPRDTPVRLRAGKGTGSPCAACGEPIPSSGPQYEPEYHDARPALRFHGSCYSTWDVERNYKRGDRKAS